MQSDERLEALSRISELLMEYVHISKDYDRTLHNYGMKEAFGMDIMFNHMEIHMLSAIQENPGITAQELSVKFYRTKGAVSQVLKFLAKEGLIVKHENPRNARINNLYITEIGRVACENHTKHENAVFQDMLPSFEDFSQADFDKLETAIKILMRYIRSGDHGNIKLLGSLPNAAVQH